MSAAGLASEVLEEHAFFRGMARADVDRLAAASEIVSVDPSTVLVRAGERSPAMWLLRWGGVTVAEEGAALRSGAAFGVGPVVGDPEHATYATTAQAELIRWTQPALERVFGEAPALRGSLAARLSLRPRAEELVTVLRRSGPFVVANVAQLRWLVEAGTLLAVRAGERIFEEGDRSEAIYVVVRGEVAIEKRMDGAPRVLACLHRGDCFGETSALTSRARSAAAVAVRTGELFAIGGKELRAVARESGELRRGLSALAFERTGVSDPAPARKRASFVVVERVSAPAGTCANLVAEALRGAGATVAIVDNPSEHTRHDSADVEVVTVANQHAADAMDRLALFADAAVVFTDSPFDASRWSALPLRAVHVVEARGTAARARVRTDRGALAIDLGVRSEHLADGLRGLGADARRALSHLARALLRRRVDVALGGGAAWGYAHCALIRGLEAAGIPIDAVAGVSFGSIAGAVYASRGTSGLDALVDARMELTWTALACTLSTRAANVFVRRHVPVQRIEDLPVPYRAVAVDIAHGVERTFRDGDITEAVRASCALPGVFAPTVIGGVRYVDACVKNNVPTSALADCADFVIASNVVPPPARAAGAVGTVRRAVDAVSPLGRIRDGVRAMYVLANDSGTRQSVGAHATFSPDLSTFFPTDFPNAPLIVDAAERALASWLPDAADQYAAFCGRSKRG